MNLDRLQRNAHTRTSQRASRIRIQRLIAIWLAAALISLSSSPSLKAFEVAALMKPAGAITTRGVSRVDGMLAISGETIFSGSSILTEQDATATISLGKLGRLELQPESGIRLSFSEAGVTGALAFGGLRVSLPAGVPCTVTTGSASVVAGGGEPVLFFVNIKENATTVTTQTGRVQLLAFGKTQQIAAGQSASAHMNSLSLDTSQTAGAQNLSDRKKAGIFLGIGGAVTILWIVLTRDNDKDSPLDFGGCVTILSPTNTPSQCP